jgi:putative hydrolase of the HAD superfamily
MASIAEGREHRCLLLDWGDTVMRVFSEYEGPMAGWPRVEAVDGIREVLTGLRPAWTIALATNATDSEEQDIWSVLARAGLDGLIDRIYCFRAVGHRKSAPAYFQHVLADLGISPDDAVMVGDDFEADVMSANRSGIRAIWFRENAADRATGAMHRTIHDLHDLPKALELLLG